MNIPKFEFISEIITYHLHVPTHPPRESTRDIEGTRQQVSKDVIKEKKPARLSIGIRAQSSSTRLSANM